MTKQLQIATLLIPLLSFKVAQGEQRPNIVWIVSEDNSKHYMRIFNPEHGVATPNLEKIAKRGVIYENAFCNAPVSSAARSTIITGCYGPRQASHYHRGEAMADIVEGSKSFPAYLKDIGYYTANNAKEDYNVNLTEGTWDESSRKGSWRNRKEGQPFFYVHNFEETHEGKLLISKERLSEEVEGYNKEVFLQPNYPDTKIFRDSYKLYCQKVESMDKQVGALLAELERDNLLEDTIIFYYGDNGGILPDSKGYLTEMGLNVPLIVYVPHKYQHLTETTPNTRDDRFVSFVDLAPTILTLAGIEPPKEMDGESIFEESRREGEYPIFGYADRMGEKYDMVRSLRKGKYKYIRNFQPFNFDALTNGYRYKIAAYQELREMYYRDELNPLQERFFQPKAVEMLYDIESDPYETTNLADDPQYGKTLTQLREELIEWQREINDLGFYPEHHLIEYAYPSTAAFGVAHSDDIDRYIEISNLCLERYSRGVERKLKKALLSNDPWDRYWAIIACHSIGEEAVGFYKIATKITQSDSELINRVRAAEFLATNKSYSPQEVMLNSLYASKDPREAALILNSMALLNQQKDGLKFNIEISKVDESIKSHPFIVTRINEMK